jgi:hypothetical protein
MIELEPEPRHISFPEELVLSREKTGKKNSCGEIFAERRTPPVQINHFSPRKMQTAAPRNKNSARAVLCGKLCLQNR